MEKQGKLSQLAGWRKRNRFTLQAASLLVGVIAPFALYYAMEGGQLALAAVFFGLLALAMAVTAWAG